MGLVISHGAFEGSYAAFNRLRQEICRAVGGSFPPHYEIDENGEYVLGSTGSFIVNRKLHDDMIYMPEGFLETHPGLRELVTHSDCDGSISPKLCAKLADELEVILPNIDESLGFGHISSRGGYRAIVQDFIKGCRAASKSKRAMMFK